MTPIETIALIFIIVAAIKIIVILAKPKAWLSVVKKVWAKPIATTIISLILAVIVLNYLLAELTIIQIFAAMALCGLLTAIGIAAYTKEIIGMAEKMLKDKTVVKKSWLALLIWIILIIWGLAVLLA